MQNQAPQEILTVPTPAHHPRFFVTGNEWVTLASIDPANASVHNVGSILFRRRAVATLGATSPRPGERGLLRPVLLRGDEEVVFPAGAFSWSREGDWLPTFTAETQGVTLRGRFVAPPGHRGFLIELEVEVKATSEPVAVALDGCFGGAELSVFGARRPPCENVLLHDGWTNSVVLEANLGCDLLALAISPGEDTRPLEVRAARGEGPLTPLAPGDARHAPNLLGEPLCFRLGAGQPVSPGECARHVFFVAVAPERDGARTTCIDLRRHGAPALLRLTREWLRERRRHLVLPELDALYNRNLLFNYFVACGRALDTEEVVSLTSRSSAYYVSGATWERDSLLWSLPALLLVEPATAREVLVFMCRYHARNGGDHAHYLDGAVLYPGFELDQLAAYFIAIERYLAATGDETLLAEPEVRHALLSLEAKLETRRHPTLALYSTFLLSSDDPTPHPYTTYGNALAWRALSALSVFKDHMSDPEGAIRCRERAMRLREAVYRHLVHPSEQLFSWSADLETGEHRLYDEPSGSLLLLPFYGFCAPDDPVFQRTVRYLHSAAYPYYFGDGRFRGHGCLHYPTHPGTLALAGALLFGRRDEALQVLRHAPLDNGLACETYDIETGEVRTGAAFATCAGLLAWAMAAALSHNPPGCARS